MRIWAIALQLLAMITQSFSFFTGPLKTIVSMRREVVLNRYRVGRKLSSTSPEILEVGSYVLVNSGSSGKSKYEADLHRKYEWYSSRSYSLLSNLCCISGATFIGLKGYLAEKARSGWWTIAVDNEKLMTNGLEVLSL